jgi:hypothetical protein
MLEPFTVANSNKIDKGNSPAAPHVAHAMLKCLEKETGGGLREDLSFYSISAETRG